MRGTTLVLNPKSFPTFELAYRIEAVSHKFEVAYGSSFNELYYDFSPVDFLHGPNRKELTTQFERAGLPWLPELIDNIAAGKTAISADELKALILGSK